MMSMLEAGTGDAEMGGHHYRGVRYRLQLRRTLEVVGLFTGTITIPEEEGSRDILLPRDRLFNITLWSQAHIYTGSGEVLDSPASTVQVYLTRMVVPP
jgi:hypothetical protein